MRAGRVTLDGRVVTDPETPVIVDQAVLTLDGQPVARSEGLYIALNKPRGLVVTAADERGRDTVYRLLEGHDLPWLAPVGRLDQASEGLLLMSNDPAWAAGITDPAGSVLKTYHVQVDGIPDEASLDTMISGVADRPDEPALQAVSVQLLRHGERNAWLEVVLDEGRNRHIRRLMAALGHEVRRLVRVAIGPIALGELEKGSWRRLSAAEVEALRGSRRRPDQGGSGRDFR